MTWNQLYKAIVKQCSNRRLADNIIGHFMDECDSYDWDSKVPAKGLMMARAQKIIAD